VFENEVLRKMFGPRREEGTGGWSELHSEDLHNFYCISDITFGMKLGR
jgi:hypothetical protein